MPRQPETIHTKRIIGLILVLVVIFLAASTRIFDYQVVRGEEFLKTAQRSSSTTVKITAARGEIVDREGLPFTKNVASFNIELDYAFLKRGSENQIIFSLIKTCEALGEEYIDTLPISQTKPYTFLPDREKDVQRLKDKFGLNTYATPQNCMDAIFERNDYRYKKVAEKKDKIAVEYEGYTEEYKRKIAGVQYEMVLKEFSSYNPRYTFAEGIKAPTVAFLKELSSDFLGVEVVEKASRTYVGGEVASHIIGKIGPMDKDQLEKYMNLEDGDYAMDDKVGQGGVEEAFESLLRGKNGQMKVIKNSNGNVIDVVETIAPEAGKTVALTINYDFNKKVNEIYAEYTKTYNETNKEKKVSKAGAITVLDAKTGGVLALTSYPYYDQTEFYENYNAVAQAEDTPLFNRALNGLYRPGSTFKPIVGIGALTEGAISADTRLRCDGVYHRLSHLGFSPTCLGTKHLGTSPDIVSSLKWSCNVFFYDAGLELGINKIVQYAQLMGLAAPTGLEIEKEPKGVISSPTRSEELGTLWTVGNVVQTAIGQMDTQVTPFQMALEAMTIGNKGTRYNAHLLYSVYNNDMSEKLEGEKTTIASQFTSSEENFKLVIDGMIEAGNTIAAPYQLTDLPYKVAVKTGTPQSSSADKFNSTFVAFAPADNPQIAISCMMEEGNYTNRMIKDILVAYENFVQK